MAFTYTDKRHHNTKTFSTIEEKNAFQVMVEKEIAEDIAENKKPQVCDPENNILVAFARGDKLNGIKHGQAVGYFKDEKVSAWSKRAYLIKKFPKSKLPDIKKWCFAPAKKDTKIGDKYSEEREYTLDLKDFKNIRNIKSIKVGDSKKVKKEVNVNPVADLMAISSGSYTYGTAGDYNLLGILITDVISLTGLLSATAISNTNETGTAKWTGNYNGYTFTITSAGHSGIPSNAYVQGISYVGYFLDIRGEGPGTLDISNLYLRQDNNVSYSMITQQVGINFLLKVKDCFFDGNGSTTTVGYLQNEADTVLEMDNCEFWDYEGLSAIRTVRVGVGTTIENCTFYGTRNGTGVYVGGAGINVPTYRNCLSFGHSGLAYTNFGASCEGYGNASDDDSAKNSNWGTGADNEINIVIANEIESTDDTNDAFLKLISSGVCHDGGKVPIILSNTAGIRGNARPHRPAVYSIGADEFSGVDPGTRIEYIYHGRPITFYITYNLAYTYYTRERIKFLI